MISTCAFFAPVRSASCCLNTSNSLLRRRSTCGLSTSICVSGAGPGRSSTTLTPSADPESSLPRFTCTSGSPMEQSRHATASESTRRTATVTMSTQWRPLQPHPESRTTWQYETNTFWQVPISDECYMDPPKEWLKAREEKVEAIPKEWYGQKDGWHELGSGGSQESSSSENSSGAASHHGSTTIRKQSTQRCTWMMCTGAGHPRISEESIEGD